MLLLHLLLRSIQWGLTRFIKRIICMSEPTQHLCVYKSFIFNIRAFGFKTALKFPVFIFSNTKITKIGNIKINCELKPGLLSIGKADSKSQGCTKFLNVGNLNINGPVIIGGCTSFANSGTVIFEGNNLISEGSTIIIRNRLSIGEYSRIGFHSFVMDSDEHFTVNIETREVYPHTKQIVIGRFNWFGGYTFIKKGTKTPDYMIVASPNALLCKDYTDFPLYSVIGGSPVRLLKSGIRRIFNEEQQQKLETYFKQNPEIEKYTFEDNSNLDNICGY